MSTANYQSSEQCDVRLLNLKQTKQKSCLGHSSIYKGIKEGWFPKPIRVTNKAVRWVEQEIDDWIRQRVMMREQGGRS